MLNGDDLYETFEDSDSTFLSSLTEIFSKVYFAVFVFIFIFAALSLFIGLFTTAYEALKVSYYNSMFCIKMCSHIVLLLLMTSTFDLL